MPVNIVNVQTITAKTTSVANVTTSAHTLVPQVGTNVVVKVNSLIIANDDNSNSDNITVRIIDSNSQIKSNLAHTIPVPVNSSLVVISKDISVYIEEGDSLIAFAATGNRLDATCSYEEIS